MYIPFIELPLESKIWIYQSNRKFTDDEFQEIDVATQAFINDWSAHGTSLEASYLLKYNRSTSYGFIFSHFFKFDKCFVSNKFSIFKRYIHFV